MLRKGWVFWCDHDGCNQKVIGYHMKQSEAIDEARKRNWELERYAGMYYCYCPDHRHVNVEIKSFTESKV